jgi:CubicO group peptidase (beta-lactamase class C family)
MSTNLSTEAFTRIIERQISASGPGGAVAVIRSGQLIHSAGYGMANIEWGQPVGSDTVFGLGSITKPFTATAIMLLERDGLLKTSDPLTNYLPGYDTHSATITLNHLLTHTSGVPNFVTRAGYWERVASLEHDQAQLRALFESLPLDFAPGERYSYSNSAYCLLGMVIERLSGMPYRAFVRQRIFSPLSMESSGYLDDVAVIPHQAARYALSDDGVPIHPPYVNHTLTYAAGALYSTVEDMARWDAALREARLLSHATLERMEQPTLLNDGRVAGYGLGWGLSTFRGRRVVHHAGGVPGYSSFMGRFVDDDLTIVILSNWGLFDAAAKLARPIAVHALEMATPSTPEPVEVDLERFGGPYAKFANQVGEMVEFTVEDGRLRAAGDINADFIATSPTTFQQTDDPDITLTFTEDASEATFRVPFYWFTVYRSSVQVG